LFTMLELGTEVGLSPSAMHRHLVRGGIPLPGYRVGKRLFYTEDQRVLILGYFGARRRFARIVPP